MVAQTKWTWADLITGIAVNGYAQLQQAYTDFAANPSWDMPATTVEDQGRILGALQAFLRPLTGGRVPGSIFDAFHFPYFTTNADMINFVLNGRVGVEPVSGGVFDDILQWILSAVDSITNQVDTWVTQSVNWLTDTTMNGFATLTGWLTGAFAAVGDTLSWIVTAVNGVYSLLRDFVDGAWVSITTTVAHMLVMLTDTTGGLFDSLYIWLGELAAGLESRIVSAVLTTAASLTSSIAALLPAVEAVLTGWADAVVDSVNTLNARLNTSLANMSTSILGQLKTTEGRISTTINTALSAWWDSFLAHVFDFTSWVGKLLDATSTWVTRDIPGHSPWWTTMFEAVVNWFKDTFSLGQYNIVSAFTVGTLNGLIFAVQPVSQAIVDVFQQSMTAISNAVAATGPITPGSALAVSQSLTSVITTTITGLIGMSVAGELTTPLGKFGLGHVAAMIYDLTNYKALTGAFVGALAAAAVAIPLRYYYNSLFRPNLPGVSQAAEMMIEGDISDAEYTQLMAFHGFPDEWHEKMMDLAYR